MKNPTRRLFLGSTAAFVFTASGGLPVRAQDDWPSETITFYSAFPPGSGADVIVRFFADRLSQSTNSTFVVVNRPGAAGNIAAEGVVRSKPDGYELLFHTGSSLAGNVHMFNEPPYDLLADLRVVATVNKQPFFIVVPTDSPFQNMKQLSDHLLEQGDAASFATNNTSGRVVSALYRKHVGFTAVEVRYGSAAEPVNDLLSGALSFAAQDPGFALAQRAAGRFRPLAVASNQRIPGAPDVPTMTEEGYPMDVVGWFAIFAPKATPDAIVDKINGWVKAELEKDDVRQFIIDNGGDVFISTPAEGDAYLAQTVEDWKGYIELAEIPKQ